MCLPVKHLQRRTESEPPLNALSLRLKLSVQSPFARAVGVEEGTPSLPRTGRAQRTRNLLIHSSNNTSTRCFRAVNNSVQKKKWFRTELDSPGWLITAEGRASFHLQDVFYARSISACISLVLYGRSNMF